jgi:fructokinase
LVELVGRESGGRLIMLDPNVRPGLISDPEYRARLESVIPLSTIVKASVADLGWLYGELDYGSAAERMLGLGVRLVIVTLGAEGAFAAAAGMRVHVAAPPVEVVDTIGAGDVFGAAVLARLHEIDRLRPDLELEEDELRALLDFACQAASVVCTRVGADPPWRSELGARL